MNRKTGPRRLTWYQRALIRVCVGGARLSCGCIMGRYLSYSEELIEVIDARGPTCPNVGHQLHALLARGPRLGRLGCLSS